MVANRIPTNPTVAEKIEPSRKAAARPMEISGGVPVALAAK